MIYLYSSLHFYKIKYNFSWIVHRIRRQIFILRNSGDLDNIKKYGLSVNLKKKSHHMRVVAKVWLNRFGYPHTGGCRLRFETFMDRHSGQVFQRGHLLHQRLFQANGRIQLTLVVHPNMGWLRFGTSFLTGGTVVFHQFVDRVENRHSMFDFFVRI